MILLWSFKFKTILTFLAFLSKIYIHTCNQNKHKNKVEGNKNQIFDDLLNVTWNNNTLMFVYPKMCYLQFSFRYYTMNCNQYQLFQKWMLDNFCSFEDSALFQFKSETCFIPAPNHFRSRDIRSLSEQKHKQKR